MMHNDKVLTLLGFAQRSKNLVSGDSNVQAALEKGKGQLLIIAEDISDRNKERWKREAEKACISLYEYYNKEHLGAAIGMSPRGVICLLDSQIARAIKEILDE